LLSGFEILSNYSNKSDPGINYWEGKCAHAAHQWLQQWVGAVAAAAQGAPLDDAFS
jgi:hypothetical protein